MASRRGWSTAAGMRSVSTTRTKTVQVVDPPGGILSGAVSLRCQGLPRAACRSCKATGCETLLAPLATVRFA